MEDTASVAFIKRKYQKFNQQYFSGRLPAVEIIVADYLDESDVHMITAKVPPDAKKGKFHIWIKDKFDCIHFFDICLLHEMVHIEGWDRHKGHGKEFDKGMLRLAKMGAFNGRW